MAVEHAAPDYGALVISLDFEIHWGVRDTQPVDGPYRQNLLGVRQAIPRMLALFEEYAISATWATVGLLFATSRQELEAYAPTIRPAYADPALSPYQEPMGAGEDDDPMHFAPGLIALIAQHPRQEIGTHTFSHYYCLEPGQTEAAFRADLASAQRIAHARGIDLRSIVLPRNQLNPAYNDLLLEAGIACYRGNERGWMYRPSATHAQKRWAIWVARWLDRYVNVSGGNLAAWPDLLEAGGLCNVPASRFLRPYTPRWRYLEPLQLRRITSGIRAAARSKKLFHLWWHPHNFGQYTDENIALLRNILEAFAECRARYGMRSLSMGEAAAVAQSHSGMHLVRS